MAIKDNKIPSPSNIKTSPQSFSNEEINKIKALRDEVNQLTVQFGHLYMRKIEVEEQEILLKTKMADIEKQEKEMAKEFTSKYGKGSINLETGTFTPSS